MGLGAMSDKLFEFYKGCGFDDAAKRHDEDYPFDDCLFTQVKNGRSKTGILAFPVRNVNKIGVIMPDVLKGTLFSRKAFNEDDPMANRPFKPVSVRQMSEEEVRRLLDEEK